MQSKNCIHNYLTIRYRALTNTEYKHRTRSYIIRWLNYVIRELTPTSFLSGNYKDEYVIGDGMVYQGDTNNVMDATDDEQCAILCNGQSGNACRMFQYCPDVKKCFMFTGRTFSPSTTDKFSACNMYTRRL